MDGQTERWMVYGWVGILSLNCYTACKITAKEDPDSGWIWLWLILPMTLALALASGSGLGTLALL